MFRRLLTSAQVCLRMDTIIEGIAFGESPRWRDGRLWVSDWGRGRVLALEPGGHETVEAEVDSFPLCIDFTPDGRLLLVSSTDRRVLRREADGSLVTHADLGSADTTPWNDIVVDGRGNAYVNNIGFDFPEAEPGPGFVVLITPDGTVTRVADDLAFPNGMAVTADGATLVVAESYAEQLTAYDIAPDGRLSGRRVWASTPGDHPDGICVDATGAVWFADVGNGHCRRVVEGGAVLDTVAFDRGAFACTLSRSGPPTLYVVGQHFGAPEDAGPTGIVGAFAAPAGGAGYP
ncbi:SMP-30/gluconolactonase/LRE family protein [Ornithinimicrobium cavernae]|uniref:SMP-30/gluconolactonase/LRE family protein n=1 Tax=Ornithinimicrobium cavernae TaxID=2666047 RepID=UPI00192A44AA|nr:SMP-30/gluconolactonase/LRE family protein [Ornithinimicrobium cavernae]